VTGFGYTYKYSVFDGIKNPRSVSLNELIDKYGVNNYDKAKTDAYIKFIQTYFRNRNKRSGQHLFLSYLRAPYHLHGTSRGDIYDEQTKVATFRVIYNLSFNDSGKPVQLINGTVYEVPIPE
jgi:hypothetical protein